MSTRAAGFPVLPGPPTEYNQQYMTELVRFVVTLALQTRNPGEVVAAGLTLIRGDFEFPTTDMGLPLGGVFQVDGNLRLSVSHKPHVNGQAITGSVGSVSVTTP